MNVWTDINPERIKPEDFVCCIEIEQGSKNKYELDKETGLIILDRVLYTSTHYPMNYGFIPHTLSGDGDPLDVFVYCSEQILPMSLVDVVPIGAIDMVDQNQIDTKIISVPVGDPTYSGYKDVKDMPPHIVEELMHFLTVYKQLENKHTEITKFYSASYAKKAIKKAMKAYKDNH